MFPSIEKEYPAIKARQYRVAGLSMGARQSLIFGLSSLYLFSYVGGFSSEPNTKPDKDLISNPEDEINKLNLLCISCGDEITL
jgi:enterochelin esterase-like enzyme